MEVSVQKPDSSDIPKKRRSADLKRVYVEKSKALKGLKREKSLAFEIRSLTDGSRRKRRRKEASLSSIGPVVTKRRRNGLNSSRRKSNTSTLGDGNFGGDSVLDSSKLKEKQTLSLSDGVVVPKRPRGILRQRKLDKVDSSKTHKDDDGCSAKSIAEVQINDSLTNEAGPSQVSGGKKKKKSLDVSKNESVKDSSIRLIKGEKNARHKTKSHSHLVEERLENGTTLVDKGEKIFEDNLDDDLEQNAARMLSSRFDTSCTGFLGSMASSSKSARGLHENIKASELASFDADVKMLRPRKRNGKSLVRKRRHFYEVSYRDVDPYYIIKQRIRIFWPLDKSWYFGLVKDYDPVTRLHYVKYDDRDEEWIDLQKERFKLLLFPSEISGKFSSVKNRWGTNQMDIEGDEKPLDDSCLDNCVESEPIIAWLTRSKHRRKLSSTNNPMKKQRTHLINQLESSNPSSLFFNPEEISPETHVVKSSNSFNDRELSFVYSRKKFCKRRQGLKKIGESVVGSFNVLASIANSAAVLEKFDVFDSSMKVKQVTVNLSLRKLCILEFAFGTERSLCYALLLLQFGKLMNMWPTVNLEIVLVDNVLGLKLFLFEGSLKCAAGILCLIITSFCQYSKRSKFEKIRMPFTSIGINLSGLHAQGGKLLFLLFRFLEMERSKWRYIEEKLKHQCVTISMPVVEFTSSNFNNIVDRSRQMLCTSVCKKALSLEKFSPISDTMCGVIPDKALHLDMKPTICFLDEMSGSLPPPLPFPTSPSLLLSLHIKSLIESNASSVTYKKDNSSSSQEFPDTHDKLTVNGSSLFEDPSDEVLDVAVQNTGSSLGPVAASSGKLAVAHLKVDTNALSISNDGDWMRPTNQYLRNEVINMTGIELNGNEGFLPSHTDAEKSSSSFPDGSSSPEKSEGGYNSNMNNTSGRMEVNEHPLNSVYPIAPRSVRHCNGQNTSLSPTFGHCSKLWRDDLMQNGFISGSKKPRTQVSYSLPFGGYDLGSKRRSHHQKLRSYKKFNADSAKRMLGALANSPSFHGLLSCIANVLITDGEKGWRVCGGQIGLESDDQKDWRICVKVSGFTKYVYKAQHILQPGITNRYTHAMMWKGGKDWTLEFTDRSQWSLFKEIHKECFNRNMRAAYVKNIPIPGVRLIADDDDDIVGVPFARNSSKYYRQVGNEVDMALDPAHVLYDMDSDDEKWVLEIRNSKDGMSEVTDDMFERVIDIFEKFSCSQQCDEFSTDEIEEFMAEVGPVDVVRRIYDYWRLKRKRKGLPLIRQFQPAMWVQYQQQLKEWESAMGKMNGSPGGSRDQAGELKKPPMFAFCLRPRGLEVPNKGLKQRSHKKLMSMGSHSSFIVRDHDGLHSSGRRTNGLAVGEGRTTLSIPSYESSDSYHSNDGSEGYTHPKLYRSNSKKRTTLQSPRDPQLMPFLSNKKPKKIGVDPWGPNIYESPRMNLIQRDGQRRHRADIDELKLRDASSAALHASNMAKMKRERAEWLHHKADLAIHKAIAALMIAEAMKESKKDTVREEDS